MNSEPDFSQARARLRSAKSAMECARQVPAWRTAYQRAVMPAQVIGLAAVLFATVLAAGEILGSMEQHGVWRWALWTGVALLAGVSVLGGAIAHVGREDAPATDVIREFFRRASRGGGIGDLVITDDHGARERIANGEVVLADLEKYWARLRRHPRGRRYEFRVSDVLTRPVAEGICQASFHVAREPRLKAFEIAGLIAYVAVAGILSGVYAPSQSAWIFCSYMIVLGVVLPVWTDRHTSHYKVTKLVVRCGDQWRLLNGDLESPEESDLSWIADSASEPASAPAPAAPGAVQTDRELAAAEHAEREAAFTRARAKLAAARAAPVASGPLRPVDRKAFALSVGTILGCISFAAMHLIDPDRLDPATWWSDLDRPLLFYGMLLYALVASASLLRKLRLRSVAPSAEEVLRQFYAEANGKNWKPVHNLARFVIDADLDAAPRRQPAIEPLTPLPPGPWRPHSVDVYWMHLSRERGEQRRALVARKIVPLEIAPDLFLLRAKLLVGPASPVPARKLLTMLTVVAGIGWLGLELKLVPNSSYLSAALPAFAGIWGVGAWIQRSRDDSKDREYTVQKLLVRSGGQWKLFCAEWEGWEEADLSWLDPAN